MAPLDRQHKDHWSASDIESLEWGRERVEASRHGELGKFPERAETISTESRSIKLP